MMLDIDDRYVAKLETFISSLPQGVVEMKNSLDDEIAKRVAEYKSAQINTTSFMYGLDSIREKLVSRL